MIIRYLLLLMLPFSVSAQIMTEDHDHAHHHDMTNMADTSATPMSHLYSLNLPMNRNGSGTAWLPDSSPMYGYMVHTPKWMLMFHGSIFIRYTSQDMFNGGTRGNAAVSAPNWFMGMAQKKIGKKGLLAFNLMLSLDRLTEGGDGYPLLFQSGETYGGLPLIDRQHPHDFFSGLSMAYTHSFNEDIDVTAYLGYPGEPAIGPVAFMHRPSAIHNPDAALSHHWSDATHITFGVGTLGLRYKWLKAEGSIFTGREPDERRYSFDRPRFDSYSYRLSFNPGCKRLAFQFSQAFLNQPEFFHYGDVMRLTASGIHTIQFQKKEEAWLSSTLTWGMNQAHHTNQHSVLLESNFHWGRWALYDRYEWVQKTVEDLVLPELWGMNHVHAITLGSNVRILEVVNTSLTFGCQVTLGIPDSQLEKYYGNLPVGGQVYFHIMPAMIRQ